MYKLLQTLPEDIQRIAIHRLILSATLGMQTKRITIKSLNNAGVITTNYQNYEELDEAIQDMRILKEIGFKVYRTRT